MFITYSTESFSCVLESTALFKRRNADNVLDKIPNEVFRKRSDDDLAEQKENQSSIPEREERLERLKDSVASLSVFLEKAKEYTQLDTLTAELLHLLKGNRQTAHTHRLPIYPPTSRYLKVSLWDSG